MPPLQKKQWLHSSQDKDSWKHNISGLMEGNEGEGFEIDIREFEQHKSTKKIGHVQGILFK